MSKINTKSGRCINNQIVQKKGEGRKGGKENNHKDKAC